MGVLKPTETCRLIGGIDKLAQLCIGSSIRYKRLRAVTTVLSYNLQLENSPSHR